MGNLFTTLYNSTGALRVYERTFQVVQNNIVNANTPGFARQEQSIISLPFQLSSGLPGGILAGPVLSARSEFLDLQVRNRQQDAGFADQKATDLTQLEPLFDLTSRFGVPNSLNKFFGSFSQLSVNPNDSVARSGVINLAKDVADSFHTTANGINQASTTVDRGISDTVTSVNRLLANVARINSKYRDNAASQEDAGLATELNTNLEELAGLINFSLIKGVDGGANVYIGGQIPAVLGSKTYDIQTDFSGAQAAIRDASGADVTAYTTGGRLGALLESKNVTIPSYLADLNTLAKQFADTVNTQLASGLDQNGQTPTVNLFAYNSAVDAASTLSVNNLAPSDIAAASAGAPGGNGNALAVAALADQPTLSGFTFTQFFGNLGARVGRDLNFARQDQQQFSDSVIQAQAQRKDQTGVDLDAEAAKILQFQRAYQAMGKMITVLNEMTDTVLHLLP